MAGESFQAAGAYQDGKAAKAAGEYNAQIAEQNAQYSIQKATEDERRARITSRKVIGDIRASFGASGVTMDGSALDVLQESAANAELDALTIRHEGLAKSIAYRNEGSMERAQGENAQRNSNLRALGYLASGGAKAASAMGGGK